MPFVNVKLVKGQVSEENKVKIIEGITDLIVNIMGRDRSFTVVTVDELEETSWAIGGKTLKHSDNKNRIVSFINIKVSKGTTNPEEIGKMMKATKELISNVLGNSDETNYFIVDELNSAAWGFGDLSMAERARLEG